MVNNLKKYDIHNNISIVNLYMSPSLRDVAKEYLKKIKAPVKGSYSFKNSAHSPLCEEPEHFLHIMINDVLAGGVS